MLLQNYFKDKTSNSEVSDSTAADHLTKEQKRYLKKQRQQMNNFIEQTSSHNIYESAKTNKVPTNKEEFPIQEREI